MVCPACLASPVLMASPALPASMEVMVVLAMAAPSILTPTAARPFCTVQLSIAGLLVGMPATAVRARAVRTAAMARLVKMASPAKMAARVITAGQMEQAATAATAATAVEEDLVDLAAMVDGAVMAVRP